MPPTTSVITAAAAPMSNPVRLRFGCPGVSGPLGVVGSLGGGT